MAKKKVATRQKIKVYELTISLADTRPLVWRKVLAHDFIHLSELHMLIQMTMGWDNAHLHSFDINGKTYSDDETAEEMDYLPVDDVELRHALGDTTKFTYDYDFGDGWHHDIEITKVLEHDSKIHYPICIGGENACPPEDCGGPHRFEHLKKVLAGKSSDEKDELLTWLGGFYDPKTFDPNFVNRFLLWGEVK